MRKFHAGDGSGDNFNTRLAARAESSVLARQDARLNGFARRAAVAHVVYSPAFGVRWRLVPTRSSNW